MATGSSGRANSGSKGFDFASDDILCSYEDFANQESFHGSHSDPPIPTDSAKGIHKNRLVRPVAYAPPSCSRPEDSSIQNVVSTVEKSMKRNADSIMCFLEGISSRLSQLELYCYNLDKSIGEMHSELTRDHDEADMKLKSLEKHVQEVHRSVQILRDKQELAETQKELAKLHFVQKDASSSSQSQTNEEKSPTSGSNKTECMSDASNQQLALALPHQLVPQQQPQPQPVSLTSQAPPQNVSQPQSYYLPPVQMQTMTASTQMTRTQYMPSDPQCCARQSPQVQNVSSVPAQPIQPQVHQTLLPQSFSHYQQQWSRPLPQQGPVPPQQQSSAQAQIVAPSMVYPPPSQPTTPAPKEAPLSTVHMLGQYSGIPATASGRPENVAIGYGDPGRTIQQQQQQQPPPHAIRSTFIMQNNDGYGAAGPNPSMSPGNTYMVYNGEGGRVHHVPQQPPLPQGPYFQTNISYQNPQSTPPPNHVVRNPAYPQFVRKHADNELVDRLVGKGFRVDHVVSVIQRMEESGQPVDFNSVLGRLSVPSSGNPQRAWSG
ncbi:ataxin-2 homolog [Rhodamnia argentea]|uniref:Ataxin-2 homolog n=1 Tax=Rhodamnia argentea TaxID=178133 RepID=A0A8B8QJ48_9MYRT|nr:ataxin-2 homolog [Rhodamnia argentea]